MQFTTRIRTPWQKWFDVNDPRQLTKEGLELAINAIEKYIKGTGVSVIRKRNELQNLKIEIENTQQGTSSLGLPQNRG